MSRDRLKLTRSYCGRYEQNPAPTDWSACEGCPLYQLGIEGKTPSELTKALKGAPKAPEGTNIRLNLSRTRETDVLRPIDPFTITPEGETIIMIYPSEEAIPKTSGTEVRCRLEGIIESSPERVEIIGKYINHQSCRLQTSQNT